MEDDVKVTGVLKAIKWPADKRLVVEIKIDDDRDSAQVVADLAHLRGKGVVISGPFDRGPAKDPGQSEFGEESEDD